MEGTYTFVSQPLWIFLAPFLGAGLWGGALIDQWKKRPITGLVLAGSVILVLSVLGLFFGLRIPDAYAFPLLTGIGITGMLLDSYPFTSGREHGKVLYFRRNFSSPILLLIMGVMATWLTYRYDGAHLRITSDSFQLISSGNTKTVSKAQLKITEIDDGPSRDWELTDGTNMVMLVNEHVFLDPNGRQVSAYELIETIEIWSGSVRDYATYE